MMSLLMIIPVIIIVIVILIAVGIRSESNRGGEDVIRNVYVYLVLFATLMMTIGGSVGVFMAAADIIAPNPYYQSFEEYKRWGHPDKLVEKHEGESQASLSEEELRLNYHAMVESENERAIIRAKNSLIKSLGWIIIPLPVFIYFQRRLNRKVE